MLGKIKSRLTWQNEVNRISNGAQVLTRNVPVEVVKTIGSNVMLNKDVYIYKPSVRIGNYTYINGGRIFYAQIGKFCSIGYNVVLGGG